MNFDSRLEWMIRAYVAKRYLNLKATIDAQITALFVHWLPTGNIIGNSQTAKQMRDLRFQYEITLESLKYSQRNATYNSVG